MALPKSRRFIRHALDALASRQTPDELEAGVTVYENGVGFNGADANFGTSLARRVWDRKALSPKQLNAAYNMLKKYENQLRGTLDFSDYPDDPKVQEGREGILYSRGQNVYFYPAIYTGVKPKEYGYSWSYDEQAWTAKLTEKSVRGIVGEYKVTLDSSVKENVKRYPKLYKSDPFVQEDPWKKGSGWVEKDGKYLYFCPLVYPSKQVGTLGWRGSKDRRGKFAWRHPLDVGAIYYLMEVFPDINFDPEVHAWMEDALNFEINEMIAGEDLLYDFQKESASHLMANSSALCSLAPGLGKTVVAIKAAEKSGSKKVLVVAPLSLLWNWVREIKRWNPEAEAIIWHKETGSIPEHPQTFVVTNYETVARRLAGFTKHDWDLLIVDESILVKNRKAKRTQAVKDLASGIEKVWLLSGSPASRFVDDMWAQLNILDHNRFSSYWRFADRYCVLEKNQWGTAIVANKEDAAFRLKRDLADIYFSRTQDDVVDLPDWVFETVEVPMYGEQERIYTRIEEEMLLDVGDEDGVIYLPNVLSKIVRSIQAASNPVLVGGIDQGAKWEAVEEMVTFYPSPFIIWVNFIDTGRHIAKALRAQGITTELLTGEVEKADRQSIVENFQSGKVDAIVAHPGVGKFGLTLTEAKTAIYLERSYNGDDYYQSLHRVRRLTSKHSCNVIHLLACRSDGTPTIDAVIDRILDHRTQTSRRLTSVDFDLLRKK